jgi:hypothetical protein
LLDGAPSDVAGGEPRHKIEFHTLYHRDGVGILLAVAWRSPTVVGSGDPAAPDPIYFSSLGTADLRVFLDLGHLPWMHAARLGPKVRGLHSPSRIYSTAGYRCMMPMAPRQRPSNPDFSIPWGGYWH